ncbi:LysR family transcriptional regulator [Cystobacter fuscus]|nr:LysR family transcriptional regulator [Cystobacter fuscus]
MDQFAAIRLFLRVVETGSLTRAAAQLGMPKSSASKLLSELEGHLGVKLLSRSTRVVKLTGEGSEYYQQVSPILLRLSEVDAEVRERGSGLRGRVRVDVHSSMANAHLIPLLGEFRALHPHIQLMVGVSDRPISLVEEAADCVIRLGKIADASLIARVIFEDRLITCASPAYLSRKGTPADPPALKTGHELVGYFSALTGERVPLVFRRGDALYEFETADVMSNDSTGHLSMILAGLGVGQAYGSTVRAHLEQGVLVPVLRDWETHTAPVSVLYPQARKRNKRVRVFIDWLVERLARELA